MKLRVNVTGSELHCGWEHHLNRSSGAKLEDQLGTPAQWRQMKDQLSMTGKMSKQRNLIQYIFPLWPKGEPREVNLFGCRIKPSHSHDTMYKPVEASQDRVQTWALSHSNVPISWSHSRGSNQRRCHVRGT